MNEKKTYLIARIAKLYPLYLLAMILDIPRVIEHFFTNYAPNIALLKTVVSSLAYIFMLQSWVPNLTPVWNSPGWSVSVEMFFYICFIPLLFKVLNCKRKFLFLLSCFLIPTSLYTLIKITGVIDIEQAFGKTLWRSLPILRVFEFLAGISLYSLVLAPGKVIESIEKNKSIVFWGSILTSLTLTYLLKGMHEKVQHFIIFAPLFCLIILSSYFGNIKGSFFFENRAITYLGLSSYALYITHQP